MKCDVCGGRTIKAEDGRRCMNAACEGAKGVGKKEGMLCKECGDPMTYSGMNQLGEPYYHCGPCGTRVRL